MKNTAPIIPVSIENCQTQSWKNELKTAISSSHQLLKYLNIDITSHSSGICTEPTFAVRVPKIFADKMSKGDIDDPLLIQVLSRNLENQPTPGYSLDPLEENSSERTGILHKYHGRVLFILTGACAVNCRYCFRRHFPYADQSITSENLAKNLQYIQNDPSITEVILSGGDPLIVSDQYLQQLVEKLGSIEHLKRLRIHTRLPVVIPQRITGELCQTLSESRLDISIVLHINHPNEIDDFTRSKCEQLSNAGVTLFNQSVLLRGVNDDAEILAQLSEKLFSYRIIPYYLHLLDQVQGSSHFSVGKAYALRLSRQLKSILPGYLVPRLAQEEPNKPSKTLLY